MENTRNKDSLRAPRSRMFGDYSGAGPSKSPKLNRLGKRKSKWTHNKNKIPWECLIKSITPLPTGYIKRMHQLWVEKRMRELFSQRLAVQVRNIKSKNILSKVEREEVMAYVCDELLNETSLQ